MSNYGRGRSLINLIGDVAFLADLPAPTTSTYITKQNVIDELNAGIAELFGAVDQAGAADEVYVDETTISTSNGTSVYNLPSAFFKLKSVEMILNVSDRVLLQKFTLAERPYLASATPGWNGEPFKYRLMGKTSITDTQPARIEFLPIPSSALTIHLFYIYCPTRLANDGDALDGFAGFEDYAKLYAAHRCAIRMENDTLAAQVAAERERVRGNVLSMMGKRDEFRPAKIQMTRETWNPRFARRRW